MMAGRRPSWCKCTRNKLCAAHLERRAGVEAAFAREERSEPPPSEAFEDDVLIDAGRPRSQAIKREFIPEYFSY